MITRRWIVALGSATALALLGAMALRPGPSTSANMLAGISQITGGGLHTCALTTAHGVMCWGENIDGQLGDGTTARRLKPVAVSGLSSGVAAVAAGSNHTCALLATGGVKCWGYNRYGQLGNGTATGATEPNPTPVGVSGLSSGVVAIAAGGAHTCALLATGGVKCWGWNRRGQIGDGQDCSMSQCRRLVPTDVTGLSSGVVAITAGVYHNCAVLSTGGVKCWGQNDAGQLGASTGSPCVDELLNPIACAQTPVDVSGLSGVARVAAGGEHSCALLTTGHIDCWGDNSSGQLGDGGSCGTTCASPTAVSSITTVNAITTGEAHTCAIVGNANVVYCWGENGLGEVGNGDSPNNQSSPVAVCASAGCASGTLGGATTIAGGTNHTCVLMNGGNLKCWGDNSSGQLGDSQRCGTVCDTPVSVLQVKAALPDLVITEMRIELETGGSCAFTSTNLGVRVAFANTGSADAGAFVVDVNGVQQTYGGLHAGASGSLWFAGYQYSNNTAIVDALDQVAESDETNNQHTKSPLVPTLPATCTPTGMPTITPTPSPAPPGDANCDGNVNSIDAALVLQYGAGLIASLACQPTADVNGDGHTDAVDAALILQFSAGLLSSFVPVPGVSDTEVILGAHTSLTGPIAAYSIIPKLTKAYFDHINATESGVNGRTINYIEKDDAYNPSQTVDLTRQLVEQDHIFAMFNALGTPNHQQVIDYLQQNGVPDMFVATGATQWVADPAARPLMFGSSLNYTGEGLALGKWILDHKGASVKVGVLYENDDFGQEGLAGVRLALGANVVGAEPYEVTDADLNSQVDQLRAANPDVIVSFATPLLLAIGIRHARLDLGWNVQFAISSVSMNELTALLTRSDNIEGTVGPVTTYMAYQTSIPSVQANHDLVTPMRASRAQRRASSRSTRNTRPK